MCRMGSLSLSSTMAEETSCAPHLRGVHPTVQLLKRWRPTRWLDPLGQWERHAGPAVGKGGSSCCTRSAGLSDNARHLCEVSQAAQTPAWASASPQRPCSQAQRKGRKRFWEWQMGGGPSRRGWPWLEGLTAVRGPPLGTAPAWERVLLVQGPGPARTGLRPEGRAGGPRFLSHHPVPELPGSEAVVCSRGSSLELGLGSEVTMRPMLVSQGTLP